MKYFIEGLLLGFAYVAPIGMQNLFMINTALTQPKKKTYLTAVILLFFGSIINSVGEENNNISLILFFN